jgi:hypothetical protein
MSGLPRSGLRTQPRGFSQVLTPGTTALSDRPHKGVRFHHIKENGAFVLS